MICHNCGYEVPEGNRTCQNCGADTVLMEKAKNASLRQYNKGVALAQEGDYSGAIACLNRCILIDKRNHVARNLLGIVYYQVGMVSDALKQWIISSSTRSRNNPSKKYINSLQKNARLLEKYDDAINMYNKALKQFNAGSDDLALIQLKKAVSLNPNFVEAYNLLTAYYLGINDKQHAKQYADIALKCDNRNSRAMYYLTLLTSNTFEEPEKKVSRKKNYGYNDRKYLKDYIRPEIVAFVVGIAATIAIFLTLVMPSYTDLLNTRIGTLEEQVASLQNENENGTSTFALKYTELQEENEALKKENEAYKADEGQKQQRLDYQLAEVYISAANYKDAAALLEGLSEENFTDEENSAIASMKSSCYPQASQAVYEEGETAYTSGNIENAKELLLKSLSYDAHADFSDNALYLLGEIAESEGNAEQAEEYYGRVVNEFTGSDVFDQSEEKLNKILTQNE